MTDDAQTSADVKQRLNNIRLSQNGDEDVLDEQHHEERCSSNAKEGDFTARGGEGSASCKRWDQRLTQVDQLTELPS